MPKQITNGGFQNPLGQTLTGNLLLVLSQDAKSAANPNQVAPIATRIPIVAGNIAPTSIYFNDELLPNNTYYTMTAYDAAGNKTYGPEQVSFTGAGPLDLGTLVPLLISPDPLFSNPVLQSPSVPQTITGQSLTLTSTAPLVVQGTLTASGALTSTGAATFGQLNKDFVVDGVKYTSIQAAVTDANAASSASTGSRVILPACGASCPSYYTFSSSITLGAFVSLIGAGAGQVFLNYGGSGAAFIVAPTPIPVNVGAEVAGFSLQGPSGAGVAVGSIGIDMQNASDYDIHDLLITRFETRIRLNATVAARYCERNHFHDLYFSGDGLTGHHWGFIFHAGSTSNDFDHNWFDHIWMDGQNSAASASYFFYFDGASVSSASDLIARDILYAPTDTTQGFLSMDNAAHTINRAIFEVRRPVPGFTTYRPFVLNVSGNTVGYDGFLADAGSNVLTGGASVTSHGNTAWQFTAGTFSGTAGLNGGGSLGGTFTGSPTLSGAVTFGTNPTVNSGNQSGILLFTLGGSVLLQPGSSASNGTVNLPSPPATITQTVGSGTTTTNGTGINTLTSQAQPAITVTGALATDTATCSLNAAMPATWQTGIVMLPPVVTANTVTVWLSNPTATATITPAATVVRCTVTR